jgi:hypothetical protein
MWSLGSNDTSHPLPYNPLDGDSYGIYADVNCAVFCFDPGADIEAPDLSGIFSPPDLVNLSAGTYYEWIYTAGDNTWHPRQNMLMVPSAAPPASTYKAPVRVVAATSITQSGTQTIDTIAVVVGDRVLCAGQATGSANGIWIVAAGAWSRASDANTSALMLAGTIVPVTEGSANVDTEWTLTTNNPIVLGTTNLVFTISGGLRGSAAPAAISPTNIAANGASVRWAPIDHTHPMVSPYKDVCRLVATTNQTLSGLSAIDGITPNSNDRVLCAGQTTASANGIYNAQSGAWTRAADANVSSNMASGALVPVSEGTANADSLWSLTTNNPITLGSTALAFLKMLPVVSGPQIETKMLSADTSNLSNSDLTQLGFNIAAGETVIMEWCIPNIGTTTAPTPIIHLQNNLGGSQAVSRCQVHSEWNVGAAINVLDFTITTLQTLHPIQQVTSSNTASNILLKVTLTCPVAVFIRPLFERNGGPAYVKAGAWGRCTRGAVIS